MPTELPLSVVHHGGRSAVTCEYRCGNACAHPAPNESGNTYFGDVVKDVVSRRGGTRASASGAGHGLRPGAAGESPRNR